MSKAKFDRSKPHVNVGTTPMKVPVWMQIFE